MSRTGRPPTIRRLLVTVLFDLAAAALMAVLAFRLLGAFSGVDTNPPVCYNAAGGVVSCSLSPPVVMLPAFSLTLIALAAWQVLRRRR